MKALLHAYRYAKYISTIHRSLTLGATCRRHCEINAIHPIGGRILPCSTTRSLNLSGRRGRVPVFRKWQ